eukprot:TRINITY_DN112725_c0_g1_i1.p1 TRINITY_DN112725_c0_g1~~TRINITY_DN112725_c0_g1_i1.p1  ORF type:complete len:398 (+),score=53.33 TRINITY_DN112725_c0_g1_i1:25-1218(+)
MHAPHKPWSKQHKKTFKGASLSLSNSFAQPLRSDELVELALARGDQQIVDSFHTHSLEYTPNGGSQDLRHEISKLYGSKITADNILVFTGAQVALQTAANALVGSGCHSIVFTPSYQSVQECPVHARSEVTKIRLKPENHWQIQIHEVESALRENTRYIVVNEPSNPAGTLMKRDVQQQLVNLAAQRGIYILSDEVYRLLEHDEKDRLPAMADAYDKGLSVVTLSKPWGACGVTIGWIAVQDMEIRQRLVDAQYFGTACPSRASEIQAIMVLRASDAVLAKNMAIIRRNKSLVDRFLEKHSEFFEWVNPTAGAIGFMKFRGPLSSGELGEQLADVGISIKPAYCFADDLMEAGCHDYDDYFRIGYGEEKMPKALEALEQFVEDHSHSWRKSKMPRIQ